MESATQEDLQIFSSLRKGACPAGSFIGDGFKVVRRMVQGGVALERILCTREWLERLEPLLAKRRREEIRIRIAGRAEMDGVVGFRLHQGVMAMARIPEPMPPARLLEQRPNAIIVALDGVSNAENVGAVVRSCAAFGVEGVVAGPDTASPWMRRAVRASLGGMLQLHLWETGDLAAWIRGLDGVAAYAAHIHGPHRRLDELRITGPTVLVLGGEADGVSPSVLAACRETIYIPMAGGWDCLNVNAAAAVLLYEATRRR